MSSGKSNIKLEAAGLVEPILNDLGFELVDVEYLRDHHAHSRRKLFCLKGIANFRDCFIRTEYCGLDIEADAKPEPDCSKNKSIIMS